MKSATDRDPTAPPSVHGMIEVAEGAEAEVRGCRLEGARDTSVFVYTHRGAPATSRVLMVDCVLSGANNDHLRLWGTATGEARGCRFEDALEAGALVDTGSRDVLLADCLFLRCALKPVDGPHAAIRVRAATRLRVLRCQVLDSSGGGLRAGTGGECTIEGGRVEGTQGPGLHATEEARLRVRGLALRGIGEDALVADKGGRIEVGSGVSIEGCRGQPRLQASGGVVVDAPLE